MKNAIEVHQLSKKYSIRHEGSRKSKTLRELFSFSRPPLQSEIKNLENEDQDSREDFWALKDVSFEVAEGGAKSRNVVIEFPSYDVAVACYHSPEYQAAIDLRRHASSADIVIVEGYDGPQP